ncbi:MAG TPA: hypothetical protein VJ810_23135 [Blastocatellia bacterium]|nr:hypothetical protein [Blastocatellia bacterium]
MMKPFSIFRRSRWQTTSLGLPLAMALIGAMALGQEAERPSPKQRAQMVERVDRSEPHPIQTAFAYQGQLKESGTLANGAYDVQFALYTAQVGGSELKSVVLEDVTVVNGLFTVKLDFGRAAFDSKESWLDVSVRAGHSVDAFESLSPRQRLMPTPYAIFAQHEQWSLIGVLIGFAGGEDNNVVGAGATPFAAATATKEADDRRSKSSDSTNLQASLAASGTPNFIAKFDGSGSPTADSIMFDDGARVAIGTTTPLSTLQVHGPGGVEQGPGGSFATASVFSTNFLLPQGFGQLGLFTTDPQAPDIGGQLVLGGQDGETDRRTFAAIAGRKENNIARNRDGYLQFSVRSQEGPPFRDLQERMRITSEGNVGIGTTIPSRKLEVFESVDSFTTMGIRNPNLGSKATAAIAVNSDGAQGSFISHSSSYIAPHRADRVSLVAESNAAGVDVVTTQGSGDIRLFTGGYSDFNERMRVTNGGAVGVGTTLPKTRLHVEGGKILVGSAGQGIILKSPNGAVCRELTINNLGGITLNAIACP